MHSSTEQFIFSLFYPIFPLQIITIPVDLHHPAPCSPSPIFLCFLYVTDHFWLRQHSSVQNHHSCHRSESCPTLEISPPRYLLTHVFSTWTVRCNMSKLMASVALTRRCGGRDIDSDKADGQMTLDNGVIWLASVAEALVGVVAKAKDVFRLRVGGWRE